MTPPEPDALAALYRAVAAELAAAATPVVIPLARARWQGPAADAFRAEMRRHERILVQLAADAARLAALQTAGEPGPA